MNTATISAEIKVSDVPLFKKLLKQFEAKSIKVEEKDPTKLSKKDFFAKIDTGLQEYENGKAKEFKSFKDFQNYISR